MSEQITTMPDFIARSFNCAGDGYVVEAGNDDKVHPGFTEHHLERIRQVLQPYFDRGILKDLGYEEKADKTLKVSYVTTGDPVFELTHKTFPSQSIKYELRLSNYTRFEIVSKDFNCVLISMERFFAAAFPKPYPRLSVV